MSIILWLLVGSGMGIPIAIVALLCVVSHYKMIFRNIASVLSEAYCITRNDNTEHSGSNTGCGFEFHLGILGECLSVLFCPM
jgi:hypothetical protein